MFFNEKELVNSANQYEVVGTVSEFNLTLKKHTQKVNIDDEEKTINSACLYGTVVVDVDGSSMENKVMVNKFTKKGDEAKSFKGLCTIAGISYDKDSYTYTDKSLTPMVSGVTNIKERDDSVQEFKKKGVGKELASRVKITGKTEIDQFLNKDKSDLVLKHKLSAQNITTTNVASEDKATFDLGGCIYTITDEYNRDGATTGRKIMELINLDFFGANVFTIIVDKEWDANGETITAEDVVKFVKLGETITVHGRIEGHTIGTVANNTGKKSLGQSSEVTRGFTVYEWVLKGLDVEEPYDIEVIKEIKKEYDVKLDNKYQEKLKESVEYSKNKNNGGGATQRSIGARTATTQDTPPADDPFA